MNYSSIQIKSSFMLFGWTVSCIMLRSFYCILGGKLNTGFCLKIEEKFNEQCIGHPVKMRPYTCTGAHYQRTLAWSPALGPSPSPALLPEGSSWALPFQDTYRTTGRLFLVTRNFMSLQGVTLTALLPFSSTISCIWAFLPSVPDHPSLKNYYCWAVEIRILRSTISGFIALS